MSGPQTGLYDFGHNLNSLPAKDFPPVNLSRRARQIMDVLFRGGETTAADVHARMPDPPGRPAVWKSRLQSLPEVSEHFGQPLQPAGEVEASGLYPARGGQAEVDRLGLGVMLESFCGGPMNRRQFLEATGSAALLNKVHGAAAQRLPNIVWIMLDDLGRGDVGCYGQEKIQTPNIDRLATEGMKFGNAYSGCTVCAPARSTLMTGLHTGHAPVRGNQGRRPTGGGRCHCW